MPKAPQGLPRVEVDVQRRFDELMIEAREVLDDATEASASGDVSERHRNAVSLAIGRISGYLDAWIRLDPGRAYRANIAAERILRVMSDVQTQLKAIDKPAE